MRDAQKAMQEASSAYTAALELSVDTERNADGAHGLRQQGRAYAQAVMRFSNAAMAWLRYADTHLKSDKGQGHSV